MVRFISLFAYVVFSCSLVDAGRLTEGRVPSDVVELDKIPVSLPREVLSVVDDDGTEVFVYYGESQDESVLVHDGDSAESDRREKVDPRRRLHGIHAFTRADLEPEVGPFGKRYSYMRGTATLISPHCLVTAAHCVVHKGEKIMPTIYFGLKDDDGSFTNCTHRVQVKDMEVHPEYVLHPRSPRHDIAVMKIDEEEPHSDYGYGALSTYGSDGVSELINQEHCVTGYPVKYGVEPNYEMVTGKGIVRRFDHGDRIAHRVYYDIDTSRGQSGSGICKVLAHGVSEVVGVHTHGKEGEELNSGVFFNDEKMLPFLIGALRRMDPEWAASNLLGAADGAAAGAEGGS